MRSEYRFAADAGERHAVAEYRYARIDGNRAVEYRQVDVYFDSAGVVHNDDALVVFAQPVVCHDGAGDCQILRNVVYSAAAQRFQICYGNRFRVAAIPVLGIFER